MYCCLPAYTALDRRAIASNICQIIFISLSLTADCDQKVSLLDLALRGFCEKSPFQGPSYQKSLHPLEDKPLPCLAFKHGRIDLQRVGRTFVSCRVQVNSQSLRSHLDNPPLDTVIVRHGMPSAHFNPEQY